MTDKPITDRQSPTTEQLDQLRAGLLDEQPEEKARVQAALANAPEQELVWKEITQQLDETTDRTLAINNQLRLRRREVLSRRPRQSLFTVPRMAMATAASLVLAVSLGLFIIQNIDPQGNKSSKPDLAFNEVEVLPDLADNLDFYVWLDAQVSAEPGSHKGI